jgi:transposase
MAARNGLLRGARRRARTVFVEAYLSPRSPGFNPVENTFARLKALLGKSAERTVDAVWNAISRTIDAFTSSECADYFATAGYEPD